MEEKEIIKCPVCGVKIKGEEVLFSFGEPGTKKRLYARVCRYAKKEGCVNDPPEKIGKLTPNDIWIKVPFNPSESF